ncbi:MAG: hypothetical protein ABEJ65_12635, partial [bacterium]
MNPPPRQALGDAPDGYQWQNIQEVGITWAIPKGWEQSRDNPRIFMKDREPVEEVEYRTRCLISRMETDRSLENFFQYYRNKELGEKGSTLYTIHEKEP